jgi:capsular polysaccharide biosynthesis protein
MNTPPRTQTNRKEVSDLLELVQTVSKNAVQQTELLNELADMLSKFDKYHEKLEPSPWMPPPSKKGHINVRQQIKVKAIEPIFTVGTDDLSRIKKSLLGRAYLKFFRPIPIARRTVFWLWKNLYPKSKNLTSFLSKNKETRWRQIVTMADYLSLANISLIKVFDAEKIDTLPPTVIPDEDQAYLVSPHDYFEFPPIYVMLLSGVKVVGGTNLVFIQDAVICHDLYDWERDYTSEELHSRHLIDVKKKRMRLIQNDDAPLKITEAAAFLDATASNYAHWLTEVLPRIAVFCSVEQHANVPIIVDDDLHPNIMESLALVVGNDREIITLAVSRALNVDILHVTSMAGYVPFERRNTKLLGHSHGQFSSLAFDLLRKKLLSFIDKRTLLDFPRKIYLRRKSEARKITNANEIEELLVDKGYVIVEPEKLTFLQQLALFSSVDEIVAPSGAALANLIFARPDARVHILIGKYDDTSYWYWQNMARAAGKQVVYSFGQISDSQSTIHSDFAIDPKVFRYED